MSKPTKKVNKVKIENKIDIPMELLLTFSNKKSLLSSKKIERFVVFITFLTITIIYLWKNISTMISKDFIEVVGLWLVYGGYSSFMNFKDRKMEQDSEDAKNCDTEETPDVVIATTTTTTVGQDEQPQP